MIYYLYVKTHSVTGLKYLGQTRSKDPHKYPGSGKYWTAHLKKHGKQYTTEILKECLTTVEVQAWGEYYSDLWKVVENTDWANLKPEMGQGGWYLLGELNPQNRLEVRKKTSAGMKKFLADNPKTEEQKKKHSEWNKSYWTSERKQAHCHNTVSVTDLNGHSKRISKQEYYLIDRSLPVEQQHYVGASSKDANRRRDHLRTAT